MDRHCSTLTGGISQTAADGTEFRFRLTANDLNAIKAMTDLATENNDTYLNYTSELVRDVFYFPRSSWQPTEHQLCSE